MRKKKHNDEDQLTFDTMLMGQGDAEPEADTYDIFGEIDDLLERQKDEYRSQKTVVSANAVDADSIFDDESDIKVVDEEIPQERDIKSEIVGSISEEQILPSKPILHGYIEQEEQEKPAPVVEKIVIAEDEPEEKAEMPRDAVVISAEPEQEKLVLKADTVVVTSDEEAANEDIRVDIDQEELVRKQKLVRFAKPDILLETPYTVTVGNKQYTRYRLEFGRPDSVIPPELSSSAGVLIPKIDEVDEEEAKKNKKELKAKGIVRELISWVSCIAIAVLLALVLTNFVFVFVKVEGDSMLHNLNTENYLFVWRAGYIFASPERGDVVICNFPDENGEYDNTTYIKRVVGLSGETISINNGYVFIDGRKLEEEYIEPSRRGNRNMEPVVLGENEYFVLGDNRINSTDSRIVGPIRKDKITGKAVQILYPFEQFAPVK